jgi:hypothetical protein
MRLTRLTLLPLAFLLFGVAPQSTSGSSFNLERLATCRDSWFEWKDDQARMTALVAGLHAAYHQQQDTDAFVVPDKKTTLLGLPVLRVFPSSIGMGVGFSVMVGGSFDAAKRAVEGAINKPLGKCETSDEMRTCGLEIAEKKSLLLLGDSSGKSHEVLVGCFYFYEK